MAILTRRRHWNGKDDLGWVDIEISPLQQAHSIATGRIARSKLTGDKRVTTSTTVGLGGAEEDVHPPGFGDPVRVGDDDCWMRPGFAKIVGVDVPWLHTSAGVGIRILRA